MKSQNSLLTRSGADEPASSHPLRCHFLPGKPFFKPFFRL